MHLYLIAVFVTLAIFILGQFGEMIWWMSKVNTTLTFIDRNLKQFMSDFKDKDHQIRTLWQRIDENRETCLKAHSGEGS